MDIRSSSVRREVVSVTRWYRLREDVKTSMMTMRKDAQKAQKLYLGYGGPSVFPAVFAVDALEVVSAWPDVLD